MSGSNTKARLITPGYVVTFMLITFLFFLWAWPNTLNDVLIKQFQKSLELSLTQTGFLPFALKFGYFCFSIPAGLFMQRKGYKTGIILGLCMFAIGCLLFYPAAASREYTLFLGAIFIMSGGASFLEIGANTFVVRLGNKSTSERRLNLAQSFNPLGGIAAAAAGTLFIFSGVEPSAPEIETMKRMGTYGTFLENENMRVFPVYLSLAIITIIIGVLIWKAKFPKIEAPDASSSASKEKGSFRALLKYPHWYGGIISQFFYLGAQLGTWSYLITYIQQNSTMGEKQAGAFLTVNMVIFMFGRFFSTWLMKYFKPTALMGTYAIINICLVLLAILGSGWGQTQFDIGLYDIKLTVPFTGIQAPLCIFALIATTFFMSLMYPTNFASGVKGLGPHTNLGASILVMSLIGGAILSFVMGRIADTTLANGQIALAMVVPMLSYCVICWYGFYGSRQQGPVFE